MPIWRIESDKSVSWIKPLVQLGIDLRNMRWNGMIKQRIDIEGEFLNGYYTGIERRASDREKSGRSGGKADRWVITMKHILRRNIQIQMKPGAIVRAAMPRCQWCAASSHFSPCFWVFPPRFCSECRRMYCLSSPRRKDSRWIGQNKIYAHLADWIR